MTRPLALALALGTAVALPLGAAAPAAAAEGTAAAPVAAADWYRPSPACATPAGCGPAGAPSPYAAGTLHVGVAAGAEESRSYLRLDTSALPAGATITGGRLRLPVASGPQDGTVRPEAAKVRACVARGAVTGEADGSFAEPPAADCAGSAPATLVPAAGTAPASLDVDLAGLAAGWSSGSAAGVLALLPAEGAAPTDTWHLALATEGAAATLTWTAPDAAPPPFLPPADPLPPAAEPGLATTPVGVGNAPALPVEPAPVAQPEVAAPPAPQQVVPQAASSLLPTGRAGFAYPAVFLLPLALAGVGSAVARAMTRDLVRDRDAG